MIGPRLEWKFPSVTMIELVRSQTPSLTGSGPCVLSVLWPQVLDFLANLRGASYHVRRPSSFSVTLPAEHSPT